MRNLRGGSLFDVLLRKGRCFCLFFMFTSFLFLSVCAGYAYAAPLKVMGWNIMAEITANQFPIYDPAKKLNISAGVRIDQPYVKWPQLRFDNRALPIIWQIEREQPDIIGLTEMWRCDDPKSDSTSGTGNIPYMVYLLRSKGYQVFPSFPEVIVEQGEIYFVENNKRFLNMPTSTSKLDFYRQSSDPSLSGTEPQAICSASSPTPFIAYKSKRLSLSTFPREQPITPKIKDKASDSTYWMASTTATLFDAVSNKSIRISVIHPDSSSVSQRNELVKATMTLLNETVERDVPTVFLGDFNMWAPKKSVGSDISDVSCLNYDFGDAADIKYRTGFVSLWTSIVEPTGFGLNKPRYVDAVAFKNKGRCINSVNSFIGEGIDINCSLSRLPFGVSMKNGDVRPIDRRRVDYIFTSNLNILSAQVVTSMPEMAGDNYWLDVDLGDRDRVHDCTVDKKISVTMSQVDPLKCLIPKSNVSCVVPNGYKWSRGGIVVNPSDHFPVVSIVDFIR